MTFIIILLALIIERFFDWNHVRRWRWFGSYQKWIGLRCSGWSGYFILLLTLLPPILLAALINHLLTGWLYGVLKLLFGVGILLYCLGPVNFWAEAYISLSNVQEQKPLPEFEKIKNAFGVSIIDTPETFHRALTNALFTEANRRLFAVIFWFILLGPAGAILYRLVDLCRLRGIATMQVAAWLEGWLDWLPVRVFTFIFALGGHFTRVIRYWKHNILSSPSMNETLLTECGIAALDAPVTDHFPVDGSAEKETLALLDRSLVIGLVILAIAVLIA
jgi:AmpE protein